MVAAKTFERASLLALLVATVLCSEISAQTLTNASSLHERRVVLRQQVNQGLAFESM